ncbi:ACL013Cp [Eremothecium gossypii ATCC 10895]|uniref:Mitochondrial distribution and morphology protein 12 n=1 Tax=Eremothecium gossypii (strain ATCC 10895 / CBS 109.51 / FGSC 9923 / NRRL Y-1056) TaxID=284811 RepID=MDM12_EREGS|nr:ACL013Cp [Eremothecium gossypii ATCC 10895]Q75CC2.2 RecName: Full=Mitochondrial distribution and morphology protein 12; AltName: Full=Mitochondrial inheritance component MDM12 [Eremothecium gossypii ATCC 10895]AAS51215.2 ACL013Cp [Eremothecium gossypii ATCC 10895]
MSFDINWNKINEDSTINQRARAFLNEHLESLQLPSYVSNIKMTDFKLGTIPPRITLKQIDNPLDDFYEALRLEGASIGGRDTDVQFLMEVDYKGDMLIELSAELVLNYPSPNFMQLPVKLTISDIGIHSLCLVAYLQRQLFISFLCDVSDPALDNVESPLDSNGPAFLGSKAVERISLIRSIKIQTEIGPQDLSEGTILRSVGKLEQFLSDVFKNLLRKEAAWPSWINLDFNEDVSADVESSSSAEESLPHRDDAQDFSADARA